MIFLKRIFKIVLITFLSGAIFFGIAYNYLDYNLNKSTANVDEKDYTVPYTRIPESKGIVFVFPNNSATLVYLDFNRENIRLLDIETYDPTRPEYNGYSADYTVTADYELVEGIIDRVGGINITENGTTTRCMGVEVIDIIAYGRVEDIKKQVLQQIFLKISQNSFSKDDFVYIIENSKTNLSFLDCIEWLEYLKAMSGRVEFVN